VLKQSVADKEEVRTVLEDIVVSRRHVGSESALCTPCRVPYPRRLLRSREGSAASLRSEHADVCPTCERLLESGDVAAYALDEERGRSTDQSRYTWPWPIAVT
jgi:hypothetical protein